MGGVSAPAWGGAVRARWTASAWFMAAAPAVVVGAAGGAVVVEATGAM